MHIGLPHSTVKLEGEGTHLASGTQPGPRGTQLRGNAGGSKKCALRALRAAPAGEPQGKIKEARRRLPSGSWSTRQVTVNTHIIRKQNAVIALGVTDKAIWDSEQVECSKNFFKNVSNIWKGLWYLKGGSESLMGVPQKRAEHLTQNSKCLPGAVVWYRRANGFPSRNRLQTRSRGS